MSNDSERELKIELDILQPGMFRAKFTYDDPDSAAAGGSVIATVTLPSDLSQRPLFDPADSSRSPYGLALAKVLFADSSVLSFYTTALGTSASSSLRIRVFANANAAELHNLKWELLCDPNTGRILSLNENTPFSRFVSTSEWKTVHLTPKSKLRALIAVANPRDLADFHLAAIDVRGEILRAWLSLSGHPVPETPDPRFAKAELSQLPDLLQSQIGCGELERITVLGHSEPVTLGTLLREINRDVDVVYLVCHGVNKIRPDLFLQDAEGFTAQTNGIDFVNVFRGLKDCPRVVVLASCESAGKDGQFAESAIAPLLADAGVPAIVAMQSKISMTTVSVLMPAFFSEVVSHGNIAQAMAAARRQAVLHKCPDAWMPALFLRLKAGALWYTPGFGGSEKDEDVAWDSICTALRDNALVPIIGQDLSEHVLGATSDAAAALAAQHAIPVSQSESPDIARIAQAVETKVGRETLYQSLNKIFLNRLLAAAQRLAPAKLPANASVSTVPEAALLDAIVPALFADPADPLNILASLDVKSYVSASVDVLLKRLLLAHGKLPYEICVDWKDETANGFDRVSAAAAALLERFEREPNGSPETHITNWAKETVAALKSSDLPVNIRGIRTALRDRLAAGRPVLETVRQWRQMYADPPGDSKVSPWPVSTPVLYYAYGKRAFPETLVLTEDDFFDYLIQHSKFPTLAPGMISSRLVEGSLLFLGFSLSDWKFRILFRLIKRQGGSKLLESRNYKHVGVQLDPDDYTPAEAIRLKRLLRDYFTASKIDLYWGSSADFLRELDRRRQSAPKVQFVVSE